MSREGSTDDNVVHVWFSIISSLMVCGLLTMALMMFWDGVRTTDGTTYLNSNLKLLNWLCAMTGIFGMYVTLITWGIMANQVGRSDGHNQEARFPDQSSLVIVLIDLISIVVGATYVTRQMSRLAE